MMSQALVEPPRIAAWLVDLFASAEQAESITGDLLEEFSDLAAKSGVAYARRWYWRQSAKTITHLVGAGFRVAPWTIIGTVLGGYVLLTFGGSLPERAIVSVLRFRRHRVTPYYTWPQFQAYLFWLNNGILVGRLLMSMLIGCIVAVAAKEREMVSTMTLSCLLLLPAFGMGLVQLFRHGAEQPFLLPYLVFIFGNSIMIFMGGGIVRKNRSAAARRRSSA
jgi:hypothetical protein